MPHERVVAPGHSRKRSLGRLAVAWIEGLCIYGPGDIQDTPLSEKPLTNELARFTYDAYAVDEGGRRLYDSAFYSRPKGANKSGYAAWIGCFEALGPCRFAGWARGGETYDFMDFHFVYEPGEPMGRAITYPFLRLMATEENQTGNVYDAIYRNLHDGPLGDAFPRKDDVGLTRVFLPGGGEIRPSTASSASKDGGKESWADFDETHLYYTPETRRMYATVRRNMGKRREAEPWSLETSTMYAPGQDSVAESTHGYAKGIRDGKVKTARLLFDHREAPADTDLANVDSLRAGLLEAYGDADYMPFDRLITDIHDPRADPMDSRRYFLNQITAFTDSWLSPQEWDACADPGKEVADGELIAIGFDGSKTRDHTAAVGCRISDSHLFTIGLWDPATQPEHRIEVGRVDEAVRGAFARYDVVAMLADVREFEDTIEHWEQDLGDGLCFRASPLHPIAFDMRGKTLEATKASESFHTAVLEKDLTHGGDKLASQYVYNARRWPNRYGVTFGKESPMSEAKVDWAAAAMLARKARQDYLALPDSRRRQPAKKAGLFWANDA